MDERGEECWNLENTTPDEIENLYNELLQKTTSFLLSRENFLGGVPNPQLCLPPMTLSQNRIIISSERTTDNGWTIVDAQKNNEECKISGEEKGGAADDGEE